MKKFIFTIIVLLLFTGSAYADDELTNAGYVIMKTGLSDLLVEPQSEDNWKTYEISLKGDDLDKLSTHNAVINKVSDYEIRLIPKMDYLAKEDSYAFWQVFGRYNDQFFYIGGLSIEGEILGNAIVPHGFALFFFLLALVMAWMVWHVNRGS
ncbi:hypothetical protein JXD20_02595 [Candidatus Peregrinibacteria bacterium]|nr:hypothetical protein [Candidatus Peregrinibacteria bacterium]